MPAIKIPFIQSEIVDNKFPINMYLEKGGDEGKDAMVGTPGLVERVNTLNFYSETRGLIVDKNKEYLYAVVGQYVYLIASDFSFEVASQQLLTSSGPVCMSVNLTQIMITDGVRGYIVTRSGSTPSVYVIDVAGFAIPSSLTMQDNYFITSQKDTFNFQISGLSDGTTWDAADIGTAEGNPDNIISIISDHRQLFLFGPSSGEIFYNSGNATFPFTRYPDVYIEDGVLAPASLISCDNSVFYINSDRNLKRLNGFTPSLVSPPKLNVIMRGMTTVSDAKTYSYSRGGSTFVVMIFPTEDKTYVLNLSTGKVHQWSSGLLSGRHKSNCYAKFNGKDLVGSYSSGIIYSLEDDTYTDGGGYIRWEYTSPVIEMDNKRLFHQELQLSFKTGVGIVSGQGLDPIVSLAYSDDGQKTWSSDMQRKLGKIGEFNKTVRWTRLGASRGRTYRIWSTDPVERSFTEAVFNIEASK